MTNEELKKKIVDIVRYCYVNEKDYGYIFDFHIEEKINAIADALIAANIGDVTEWKERAEKAEKERDEWKERAERMHKERISKDYEMKEYQRITEQRETPLVMSQWSGDSNSLKIYNRLSELEDKIESGEIVDRNSYLDRLMAAKDISGMSDKEIEFFAKHNARVRENADAEIARLTAEAAEARLAELKGEKE